MAESIIKSSIIMLIMMAFMAVTFLRFQNCEGDYCTSVSHAKMKWDKLNETFF